MRFGLHNSRWLDTPDPAAAFANTAAKARWAEDHGFAWFSVLDHMIQIPRAGAPDEPVLEGWTVLAALAAVTARIRLATLVTAVGFRNPAHLAKIAATVDIISGGRLTLGIGAGFLEDEYRQYGWDFPERPATRLRQLEEAVELIKRLWTEPRTTHRGRHYRTEDAILEPKPLQRPHPPILIAGAGEQVTLRLVARHADACNLSGGEPAEIRHKLAVLHRHCNELGRDPATIEKTYVRAFLLARTEAEIAAKRHRLPARDPTYGFAGTVQQAIDLIGEYRDAGIDLLIVGDRNDPETRELFATEIVPRFG